MNYQKKLSLIPLIIFLLTANQVFAQDFTVDMNKLEKTYPSDFSKPFTINFKNGGTTKVTVALKQGDIGSILKENANLAELKIQFSPSEGVLTFKDKEDKVQKIPVKDFVVAIGEKSFTVSPKAGQPNNAASNDILIDLNSKTTDYEANLSSDFKISFKPTDAKPKDDVVISATSSEGKQKLTLKQQDLAKLKIPFVFKDKVLTVDDGKGTALKDDDGKAFKIDEAFTVDIAGKSYKIANKPGKEKEETATKKPNCPPAIIIDNAMLAAINSGSCQLCDTRAKKEKIESKKDRVYSTDYIVLYDPMLKKDAYTICKHVFERMETDDPEKTGRLKFYERYIKVGAKWFAPHVGSQIRFEVVNLPLNSTFNLSVNENDVFNGGASQFASIINSLVNANIISPLTGTTQPADTASDKTGAQVGEENACLLSDIDQIASDLLKYMAAFRISSCAIEQHNINLPIILARINERFKLSAATAEQLEVQLTKKIDDEVGEKDQVNAVKKAALITNALKALENVKPVAYTTLRAKNRDYIEVRYTNENNVLSKPENIRMSGGMKIDFSAGFILTGLRDYSYVLKNIKYGYTPVGSPTNRDTTGNVIVKEDEGNNQVGVGLLTHFYPRSSSHYNLGGTVGLMTSTSLNLRLMLGGSLMFSSLFGSNNRVSFSGGLVWGKVKRLSEKDKDYFNAPRVVNNIPEFFTEASAPTPIDRTDHSWFFAITMNFGGN